MQVIDLVSEYVSHDHYRHDYASYERKYPRLFEHYFTYFASRKYLPPAVNNCRALMQRELILAELPLVEEAFADAGLPLTDITVVLFVGVGTSNGHAFEERGRFLVWLPVESYATSWAARIFLVHEIAHALHYMRSPHYYFHSLDEMQNFGRILVSEGVATYIAKQVLDVEPLQALWADYLSPSQAERWLRRCESETRNLAELCIKCFKQDSNRELFQANDPGDIYRYRAGYYIGLEAVEKVVAEQDLNHNLLLSVKRKNLDGVILQALQAMQAGE